MHQVTIGRLALLLALATTSVGCGHSYSNLRLSQDYLDRTPGCVAVAPFENLSLTSMSGLVAAELAQHELNTSLRSIAMGPNEFIAHAVATGVRVEDVLAKTYLDILANNWGVDAVLVGTVTEYWYTDDPEVYRDKQPSVAISMKLVDTRTGKTLWESESAATPSSMRSSIALLSAVAADSIGDIFEDLERRLGPLQTDKRPTLCNFESPTFAQGLFPPPARGTGYAQPTPASFPVRQAAPRKPLGAEAEELVALLKRGEPSILPGVRFQYGKPLLQQGSQETLDVLGEVMLYYPDLEIRVIVHSDNIGDPDENLELTTKQAQLLQRYLVRRHEVNEGAIEPLGRGGSSPLLPNINRRNRMLNRRVEIMATNTPQEW